MAYTKRIEFNRNVLDKVTLAIADGMGALGVEMIRNANVPDAPPLTEGLVNNGGVLVYYNGKKVFGWGLDGKQPKPPRAARVSKSKGVVMVAGYGRPAHFVEMGTAKQPARPFFTPAVDSTLPRSNAIMGPVIKRALPRKG